MQKRENLFVSILKERCPNCGKSTVYYPTKSIFHMPVMKINCDECNYKFDREPGYFLGAMYISYAIAVFLGISTFALLYFLFPNLSFNWIIIILAFVMIIAAKKNYKLSRIIYIHIFPK
jgi:uncharacterized protein (DUF983 family)